MEIHADYRNSVLYLQLCGEIDEHNAAAARSRADRLADEHAGSEKAVFDLSKVSFMDSTGIGFLIGRYKRFRRYGVPVYLTNPTFSADRILQMSGIYTLMPKI
jgi:stage II sporulation protein AA (anti-sigma F factor antagonist)